MLTILFILCVGGGGGFGRGKILPLNTIKCYNFDFYKMLQLLIYVNKNNHTIYIISGPKMSVEANNRILKDKSREKLCGVNIKNVNSSWKELKIG